MKQGTIKTAHTTVGLLIDAWALSEKGLQTRELRPEVHAAILKIRDLHNQRGLDWYIDNTGTLYEKKD